MVCVCVCGGGERCMNVIGVRVLCECASGVCEWMWNQVSGLFICLSSTTGAYIGVVRAHVRE